MVCAGRCCRATRSTAFCRCDAASQETEQSRAKLARQKAELQEILKKIRAAQELEAKKRRHAGRPAWPAQGRLGGAQP